MSIQLKKRQGASAPFFAFLSPAPSSSCGRVRRFHPLSLLPAGVAGVLNAAGRSMGRPMGKCRRRPKGRRSALRFFSADVGGERLRGLQRICVRHELLLYAVVFHLRPQESMRLRNPATSLRKQPPLSNRSGKTMNKTPSTGRPAGLRRTEAVCRFDTRAIPRDSPPPSTLYLFGRRP